MKPITGSFAPVPTPLTDEDRFDRSAMAHHLSWLRSAGLDGALILGTNGEFASLSLNERQEVASAAAEAGSGLTRLLNIGACALPEALKLLAFADRSGYKAVLCPPPFYFRRAPIAGLASFFRRLLDAARLPVLLYHIPQLTGVPIDDALLDSIGNHPQLAGVKDSSGDRRELQRLCARFAGHGSYLVGHDTLITATQEAGGAGSISAAASIAPELVKAVAGDPSLQHRLDRLRAVLDDFGLGPAIKAVLRHHRLGRYATRPPLQALPEEQVLQLLTTLDRLEKPATSNQEGPELARSL